MLHNVFHIMFFFCAHLNDMEICVRVEIHQLQCCKCNAAEWIQVMINSSNSYRLQRSTYWCVRPRAAFISVWPAWPLSFWFFFPCEKMWTHCIYVEILPVHPYPMHGFIFNSHNIISQEVLQTLQLISEMCCCDILINKKVHFFHFRFHIGFALQPAQCCTLFRITFVWSGCKWS